MSTAAARKLRILCFHGYLQDSFVFKTRIAALKRKLKNVATLGMAWESRLFDWCWSVDFLDGPFEATPLERFQVDQNEEMYVPFVFHLACLAVFKFGLDCLCSWGMSSRVSLVSYPCYGTHLIYPCSSPKGKGWWTFDGTKSIGYEQAVEYVANYMKQNGPYDGLLGFSQGGTMACYLALLQQQRISYPGLLRIQWIMSQSLCIEKFSEPFHFVISVAGGFPTDESMKVCFDICVLICIEGVWVGQDHSAIPDHLWQRGPGGSSWEKHVWCSHSQIGFVLVKWSPTLRVLSCTLMMEDTSCLRMRRPTSNTWTLSPRCWNHYKIELLFYCFVINLGKTIRIKKSNDYGQKRQMEPLKKDKKEE